MPRSQTQIARRSFIAIALSALALGLVAAGCSKQRSHHHRKMLQQHLPSKRPSQQARHKALQRATLSSLAIARSLHQRATLYQKMLQPQKALAELDKILALRFPKQYRPGEEMLLDAWARKSLLYLQLKQPAQALSTIEAAIRRPSWLKRSFYKAHLHHVHGRILTAHKRPKEALRAFQRSIEINKAVIREAQKLLPPRTRPPQRRPTPRKTP